MLLQYCTILAGLAHQIGLASAHPPRPWNHSPHRPGWTNTTKIPIQPRQENTAAYLDGSIYLLGGIINQTLPDNPLGATTTSMVQAYDIDTREWRSIASLPTAINHGNVAVVDNKLYILGGLSLQGGNWIADNNASYVYCSRTNTWRDLAPIPSQHSRGSAAVVTHGSKVYLAGGLRELDLFIGGIYDTIDTVSVYDTRTDTWDDPPAAASRLPEGRDHVAAALVDDIFYVLGGRINATTAPNGGRRDTVFALDLDDLEAGWSLKKGRMPTPRGGLSFGAVGKKVCTFGGEGNPEVESGVFNVTEVYDIDSDSWSTLRQMPLPVHGTYAAVKDGRVYIPGGGVHQNFGPTNVFQIYTPEHNRW
ncbi:hypothetical protein M409DRAFT_24763 [Zasmidium cellare ATCC 36951]|uniref:PLD phosphodiesterase domain-containing protein n=1 Tax=Zasmidium cellare ATCC 36951 TaxID=1080233 RepID=A0A6A6CFC0_ZASCE|nr:uncharacterized protein M409DRAFT_24763 [Zasmidium cellare ATCC 36951]KAF2164858.1 hypothetical protein M409DRAFT_24763 [Zasmidium cellare ATCC 36951]